MELNNSNFEFDEDDKFNVEECDKDSAFAGHVSKEIMSAYDSNFSWNMDIMVPGETIEDRIDYMIKLFINGEPGVFIAKHGCLNMTIDLFDDNNSQKISIGTVKGINKYRTYSINNLILEIESGYYNQENYFINDVEALLLLAKHFKSKELYKVVKDTYLTLTVYYRKLTEMILSLDANKLQLILDTCNNVINLDNFYDINNVPNIYTFFYILGSFNVNPLFSSLGLKYPLEAKIIELSRLKLYFKEYPFLQGFKIIKNIIETTANALQIKKMPKISKDFKVELEDVTPALIYQPGSRWIERNPIWEQYEEPKLIEENKYEEIYKNCENYSREDLLDIIFELGLTNISDLSNLEICRYIKEYTSKYLKKYE